MRNRGALLTLAAVVSLTGCSADPSDRIDYSGEYPELVAACAMLTRESPADVKGIRGNSVTDHVTVEPANPYRERRYHLEGITSIEIEGRAPITNHWSCEVDRDVDAGILTATVTVR